MDISNPRRVLAVALEGSTVHLTKVIRDLTGTNPQQTSTSLAGTTHNLSIKTAYYTAEVPIWLDLIASPEEWAESFLSPEAKEVLDVLGGIMVVFALPPPPSQMKTDLSPAVVSTTDTGSDKAAEPEGTSGASRSPLPSSGPDPASSTTKPPTTATGTPATDLTSALPPPTAEETRALLKQIGRVVNDGLGGWSWDGVSLCVGVGEADDVDEWEELAAGCGLEFVQVRKNAAGSGVGRNEFGEKTGIPRLIEALESNDWDQGDMDILDDLDVDSNDDDDDDGFGAFTDGKKDTDIDPKSLSFGFDREDFEGLRRAIWTSGQEVDAFASATSPTITDAVAATTTESTPIATTTTTAAAAVAAAGDAEAARQPSTDSPRDTSSQPTASAVRNTSAGLVHDGNGNGKDDEHLDEEEVEKIERMMLKLSAVRDMAAGLPEDQRRRMAARAVGEVMREI